MLQAQPFGNEWIDYNQTHYKIKVAKDGMYRIPYSTLSAIIPNLGSVNAASFVMYHNGQAVPIRVTSNTTLGSNDYIEFYGRKNIGDVDSFLYKTAAIQPHPYHSLYTDTAIYFLTVKTGSGNPRFTLTQNNLVNVPAPESYFLHTVRGVYASRYYEGRYYNVSGDEVYKSNFEDGEGFVSSAFFGSVSSGNPSQLVNQTFNLATPYINYTGSNATYKTVFVNNSNESHAVRIGLNSNVNLFTQTSASGFRLAKHTFSVPLSSLNNTGNNVLTFSETTNAISKKQNAVYMNELTYPRDFNFDGLNTFYFKVDASGSSGTKTYLRITNFNDEGLQPVLYDLANNAYIPSTGTPGTTPLEFALPGSTVNHELYLISGSSNSYNTVSTLTPVQFINYSASNLANQAEYAIISHKKLNDGSSTDIIEEYRAYRDEDVIGGVGKYRARIYDIEQLYDQFAYGVYKSPLAIRNFVRYAQSAWFYKPTHVFLMGKAREYNFMRNNTASNNQCLVPTFGFPGSDNLLVTTRTSDMPLVAVGRLAAENRQEVEDYLDKIKTYELEQNTYNEPQLIAPKLWQKRVMTFSGGTSAQEQSQFRNFNEDYIEIAEDTLWGAKGIAYSRTSNAPIEESQSLQIKQTINEGVSLVTFFGHSATGAFDFSVDEPENYTNIGRYPVFISNGCFAGLIHDAGKGYSERFVFKPEAGTIAFIATTSLSLPSSLDKYTEGFYKEGCTDEYTESIGEIIAESLKNMYNSSPNNFDYMAAYEFTLHGDPGIKLNQYPKPDYAIEQSSVFFNPSTVTPAVDSFKVNLVVTNLGRAIKDSIAVTMKRKAVDVNGNPQEINVKRIVPAPYYLDTLSFTLPTLFLNAGYGLNEFEFYVDADFEIDEMSEQNNGLMSPNNAVTITIVSDDIIPIYPYEFSIIPNNTDTLKASTVNPFAPVRNYRFEIDTSELYAAPLASQVITQGGGVVKWKPNLTFIDSTVYYWRVAFDSVPLKWHYTSFLYLDGERGWNQSHHYQYRKDSYFNVKLDSTSQIFNFPPSVNEIKVITGKADAVGGNLNSALMGWDYNNNNMHRYRMGGCGFTRGLTFAVINNVTGTVWTSTNKAPNIDDYGDAFGNFHCDEKAATPQNGFDFLTSGTHASGSNPSWSGQQWSTVIKNFIDAIPNNYFVLIYSNNEVQYTSWDATLIQALQNLGMAQALPLSGGQMNGPFVFFTQKGNTNYPSSFENSLGYANPLVETVNFNGVWYQGNFSTPVIGPAFHWTSMHWTHDPLENQNVSTTDDIDSVDLIGITAGGAETVLLTTTQQNTFNLNTIAPAATYPYLRMRLRTKDDTLRTPTQLKYWRIMHEQVPEAAMNPSAHFMLNDNLPIGGNLHIEIALENVTDIPMDSMLTKFTIRDAANNNYVRDIRYDSLRALNIMHLVFDTTINGNNYNGTNKIIIEANPDNDQLEQYHFNNFAEINFNAIGDNVNPLLDVTFDGQHILNGDIVSAKPNILISLKDENKFLALNDTSLMSVFLKYPGEATPRKMEYDNLVMTFYPADSNNLALGNKAQIELKPTLTLDGTYELIVKDRDRSGNNSSQNNKLESNIFYDFKISFEVINKPMVTNVLNYPNPFTTSTRFVFTLTGSQVPDYMKIQIMTIKGTVVKEITKDELGDIHMGRNITEYAWNGRDQYGDPLANGVYFYRVITRLDDKQMDHLNQGYDKYFKKGFGKLVIVR